VRKKGGLLHEKEGPGINGQCIAHAIAMTIAGIIMARAQQRFVPRKLSDKQIFKYYNNFNMQ